MNRIAATGIIAVTQLALVGVGVAPQLSARLAGDTYLMNVAPIDPLDPFRGAYVALDYPDLRHDDSQSFVEPGLGALDDGESGDVFITLEKRGDAHADQGQLRHGDDGGGHGAVHRAAPLLEVGESLSRAWASSRRARSKRKPVPRNTVPSTTNSQAPVTIGANTAKLWKVVKTTRPTMAIQVSGGWSRTVPRTTRPTARTT